MRHKLFARLPAHLRWLAEILLVVAIGLIVAFFCNVFLFRFYTVTGSSMQPTLATGDVLLINKVGRSVSYLTQKPFIPKRLQLVVFKNPLFTQQSNEEFIIKRVIGLPGERIVIKDTSVTIYNQTNPSGFNPDTAIQQTLQLPTAGTIDRTVPEDELFVVGDNRIGEYSFDSRNGLSTVRVQDVEGIATFRAFPIGRWDLLQQ